MKVKEFKQINLKGGNRKIMKTKIKQGRGITLIALVITIVVLLILAGVSINAIFSENGIINKAKDAQNKMDQATQNDLDSIDGLSNWINSQANSATGGESTPVTNPYADQQWTMAYVCNNGTWSDTPLVSANGDTIPEGAQIVAKFYATGEKITTTAEGITIPEGEEYKVVIEGTGKMGGLAAIGVGEETTWYAWQKQIMAWEEWVGGGMQGDAVSCITPYITELTICNGITNIGDLGFALGISLKKVTLSSTIKEVGESTFDYCVNLPSVTIPNSITKIGKYAFSTENEKITKLLVENEAMAKIVNGSYYGDTAKVIVANENSIAQNTINAKEVANHPVIYCGKEVKGYTCDNSVGVSKWKIYHSDGKNIYLIADNYITGEYIPSKDGETMTASTSHTNAYYFNDTLLNKYTGASNITDTNIIPWLSYLKSSYGENNTNKNMQATAYLLDTEIWKGFKNTTKAKYAIGAPTLDMYVASYNTRFAKQIELISQETGYKIGFKDEDTYDTDLNTYDYLLAHKEEDGKAYYMWLASPSAGGSGDLMDVHCDGNVNDYGFSYSVLGVRPLVCLESEVTLEKQEINGEIVYNIK